MPRLRPLLVLLHRYVGLVMAAFLVLAGVTGAPLSWYYELDAALNPHWLRVAPPTPGAQPLPPLVLRDRVQQHHPQAEVHFAPLVPEQGGAAVYFIGGRRDAATGVRATLDVDQVFVDPYTGTVLGGRRWGDITQGVAANLLPFVYRLHYEIALGTVGTYAFGIVALLWTLDCFVGALLTLPRTRAAGSGEGWGTRWRKAWQVRWRGGAYKVNFDLHRAGGLWLWAWLFVFAWSSVAFNLREVYYPVMHALFDSQEHDRPAPAQRPRAEPEPAMGWEAGLVQGRKLMDDLARREGFTVVHEQRLSYRPQRGVLHYRVRSDRDIRDRRGTTSVDFDAATGAVVASYVPTGAASGDTITSWLLALHMADVWGQPFKVAVFLLGIATAGLSGTGVWIWWRKRKARSVAQLR